MATRLDREPTLRREVRSMYPWHEWEDGAWWRIEQGEDFNAAVASMSSNLYIHARRHGMAVRVKSSGPSLAFQFTK